MKTLILFLTLLSCAFGKLPIRAYVESSYLIPGEITQFVIETNGQITENFNIPESEQYRLTYRSASSFRDDQNALGYRYFFDLTSLYQGTHKIPSLEIKINGETEHSYPLNFQVVSSQNLHFDTVKIGDQDVTYATSVFLPERDLYVGETVPTEIKIYLPHQERDFTVIETGLPDIKRENMSAWRFQNPRSARGNTPFLLAKGRYFALTYRSSARALKAGTIGLGEGTARPVFKAVINKNGRTQWVDLPIFLPLKMATRKALPLPDNAPSSFKGAVGTFDLNVELDGAAESNPDSPISARISVFGTGNLDKIEVPILTDENNWKLYPSTKKQRDAERRYLSGTVEFTQLLRPKTPQSHLPPFEFSFFNPNTKSYQTLTTPKIPLSDSEKAIIVDEEEPVEETKTDTPKDSIADTPSPNFNSLNATIPRENMADVLDLLPSPNLASAAPSPRLWRYWQIIPAIITLGLITALITRYLLPAVKPSAQKRQVTQEIKTLQKENEPVAFLKKAANITRLFPASLMSLKEEIATLRDQACFQPDKSSVNLSKEDRKSILSKLSIAAKQLVVVGLFTICLTSESKAEGTATNYHNSAMAAVAEKDYATALSSYLNAYPNLDFPADVLYNIGTLYAKMDEPGQAMLYYRRVLFQQPDHPEAKQNLNYMERVHGSIVIRRSGIYHFLSKISLTTVKTICYALGWVFLCLLFAMPLVRNSKYRPLVFGNLLLLAFLLPLSIAALLVYPNDGKFCPTHQMAIITTPEPVTAKTGAAEDAEFVITVPPGSIAKVLTQRGLWAYLEFSDNTRAWLDTKNLSMLAPDTNFLDINPVESKSDL